MNLLFCIGFAAIFGLVGGRHYSTNQRIVISKALFKDELKGRRLVRYTYNQRAGMHDRLYIIETLSKFAANLRANVSFAAPCYMLSHLHSKVIVDCGKNWQGYYISPDIEGLYRNDITNDDPLCRKPFHLKVSDLKHGHFQYLPDSFCLEVAEYFYRIHTEIESFIKRRLKEENIIIIILPMCQV